MRQTPYTSPPVPPVDKSDKLISLVEGAMCHASRVPRRMFQSIRSWQGNGENFVTRGFVCTFTRSIKWKRWAGCVACMRSWESALSQEENKRQCRSLGVDGWIALQQNMNVKWQDRAHSQAVMNTVKILRVPNTGRELLTSWAAIAFLTRAPLHEFSCLLLTAQT